ncbi:heme biosynthesis HemY N-terminal domain-containing protein [Celerinatantimonas yamalensis]|uniref:Heme biosynthesis HemY N-terminal domain-containing protein n=1 Tax=Celerinatantimonas yamalensis TaxID=559956 RepID=A0ABW9G936_9GAMM
MIRLFLVLLVAAAGMLAGPLLEGRQGYVLIAMGHYTIEMSVVAGITALIVFYIIAQLLFQLLKQLWRSGPGMLGHWRNRRQRNARLQTQQGLLSLYQGDYQDAQEQLAKSARSSDSPSLNYLSAARAAASQGDLGVSDKLLEKADKQSPNSQTRQAVWLARAKLKLEAGDLEAARTLLDQLPASQRHRPSALQIRYQLAKADHNWDSQLEVLEQLAKFQPERWQSEQVYSYTGKFDQLAKEGHAVFDNYWHGLSRKFRQQSWVIKAAHSAMLTLDRGELLATCLQKQLKAKPIDEVALNLVPKLAKEDSLKLLPLLQKLAKSEPQHAQLLTVLGAVYILQGQLDEAQQQLQTSQNIQASARTYRLLGDICAARHDNEQALSWYQKALAYRSLTA